MTEFRHALTEALGPIERRLDGIERRQIAQGELIARLDERSRHKSRWNGQAKPAASSQAKPAASGAALNGHAKTMGGAGMMAVVWALVEIIQVLIAAP